MYCTGIYLVLIFLITFSDCARILATIPTPSYSHQMAFRPLWKELGKRGHEIILMTTDPMKEKLDNIRQIDLSASWDIWNKYNFSLIAMNQGKYPVEFFTLATEATNEIIKYQMGHPEVQELLKNTDEKFDLLMMETLYPGMIAFSEIFQIPVIGLTSLDAPQNIHTLMGNEAHPVLNPDALLPGFVYPLTFSQRIISFLYQTALNWFLMLYFVPLIDEQNKEYFGKETSSVVELMKNVDMLFVNTNPLLHSIRALTPNTVTFGGGIHFEDPKPLPKHLKDFLDGATEGFIYFSLGSNVKTIFLDDKVKKSFFEVFAELPYKVLCKFDGDSMGNVSGNVLISKWIPQIDVLRNPNIKLFITQCGLHSLEEGILSHVPMVAIPFFVDQPVNAANMQKNGMGISLDLFTLDKDVFKTAVLEVITNPKYKEKTIEVAGLLKDVEMPVLEKLVWWTEYVIRHKGAKHLRNPILEIPTYQYYFFDVIAFITVVLSIIIYGFVKILAWMLNK